MRLVYRPREFGTTRTDQTRQADDLPGMQVERHIVNAGRGEPSDR